MMSRGWPLLRPDSGRSGGCITAASQGQGREAEQPPLRAARDLDGDASFHEALEQPDRTLDMPLLGAAGGMHPRLAGNGTRPPIRVALICFWVRGRALRAPDPLTDAAPHGADTPQARDAWTIQFRHAVAGGAIRTHPPESICWPRCHWSPPPTWPGDWASWCRGDSLTLRAERPTRFAFLTTNLQFHGRSLALNFQWKCSRFKRQTHTPSQRCDLANQFRVISCKPAYVGDMTGRSGRACRTDTQ